MRRWSALAFLCASFACLSAGCTRQDAERLSRIGHKVSEHARSSSGEIGAKIDLSWTGKREPSLQAKVEDRLRYDNALGDVKLEVVVNDKEIELKGAVKTDSQRRRAIELTENTIGVVRVVDTINVREPDAPAQ